MLTVGSRQLAVSIVDSLVVAVILPSVVQTFSIVYSNPLRRVMGGVGLQCWMK